MNALNTGLLFLHFLGLTMGLSVPFSSMVVMGLAKRSPPGEAAVLVRVPPLVGRIGRAGLAVMWATGLVMVYTIWGGFAALPWPFHVKFAAVLVLTAAVLRIWSLERKVTQGDRSVLPGIEATGKLAFAAALVAMLFAVLAFR
jgi:hypothetical protein